MSCRSEESCFSGFYSLGVLGKTTWQFWQINGFTNDQLLRGQINFSFTLLLGLQLDMTTRIWITNSLPKYPLSELIGKVTISAEKKILHSHIGIFKRDYFQLLFALHYWWATTKPATGGGGSAYHIFQKSCEKHRIDMNLNPNIVIRVPLSKLMMMKSWIIKDCSCRTDYLMRACA